MNFNEVKTYGLLKKFIKSSHGDNKVFCGIRGWHGTSIKTKYMQKSFIFSERIREPMIFEHCTVLYFFYFLYKLKYYEYVAYELMSFNFSISSLLVSHLFVTLRPLTFHYTYNFHIVAYLKVLQMIPILYQCVQFLNVVHDF